MNYTNRAASLWAKKSVGQNVLWLPLVTHMADSAGVARKIWDHWLPEGLKRTVNSGISSGKHTRQLLVFLTAAHDIGKATPVFQAKRSVSVDLDDRINEKIVTSGLPMKKADYFARASKTPHALATQYILERAGAGKNITAVLGAHHGKPPDTDTYNKCGIDAYPANFYLSNEAKDSWTGVQSELVDFALKLAGFASVKEIPEPDMTAQVLLCGLVIMTDWIASREEYFPYFGIDDAIDPDVYQRADFGWQQFNPTQIWRAKNEDADGLCEKRFHFAANEVQKAVLTQAVGIRDPGIFIIEAPMGMGKTEAALLAAETFAVRCERKGIYFALPTQATSDGIFGRIESWIQKLESGYTHSMHLMHGKAELNEDYGRLARDSNVGEEENDIIVHQWFDGRKKAMLDDFVVGTIDQLLLAALKQKHIMLRHLGLANKVVIIDECHAYDAYMNQYLYMALRWLGAYKVPVIVLSATLSTDTRRKLIEAYGDTCFVPAGRINPYTGERLESAPPPQWVTNQSYPLLTWTDSGKPNQISLTSENHTKIGLSYINDDTIVSKLEEYLSCGGCAGIIVNTVSRSQQIARMLADRFGEESVTLLHSRFISPQRAEKERELLSQLGKPGVGIRPRKHIVVGTQVLEQSLDIDFDIMITDLCPVDLLLQRIGRLHRHKRDRPEKLRDGVCYINEPVNENFERGSEFIYGKYLLMRTKAILQDTLSLPRDIPKLVNAVYGDTEAQMPDAEEYRKAKSEHIGRIEKKEKQANDFRISPPYRESTLINWLNTDVSDNSGEAAVRDADESFEVIVMMEKSDFSVCFLPWLKDGRELPRFEEPDRETAKAVAACTVRLPAILCYPGMIEKTIKTLEETSAATLGWWQKSPWLKGSLFLLLDSEYSARLCGYKLTYDEKYGLMYEKEKEGNADG